MDFLWAAGLQSAFFLMVSVVFILVTGIIIFAIVKVIAEWNQNNYSPKLQVSASIIAKRIHVSHHPAHTGADAMHWTGHTFYYVTFQEDNGNRRELRVNGKEYGMLAEGDHGILTFQGTRYLGFERIMSSGV